MPQQERVDPVTIEVVRNYMQSTARQMRNVLVRASCNPVIYEIVDFSQALYNAKAELLGQYTDEAFLKLIRRQTGWRTEDGDRRPVSGSFWRFGCVQAMTSVPVIGRSGSDKRSGNRPPPSVLRRYARINWSFG